MTGAYLRIYRNGKWQNIEIDQLNDEELDQLALEQPERGWIWAKFLAKWIRQNLVEAETKPQETFAGQVLGEIEEQARLKMPQD